jgi:ribose-phosphate pyrophosphokinase
VISHGKEVKVFAGNSNPKLAEGICHSLSKPMGKSVATAFSDGESSISVLEPVRGADVFIIQSTCTPVNDNLVELLIMIDAMRRASAAVSQPLYHISLCTPGPQIKSPGSYFCKIGC